MWVALLLQGISSIKAASEPTADKENRNLSDLLAKVLIVAKLSSDPNLHFMRDEFIVCGSKTSLLENSRRKLAPFTF